MYFHVEYICNPWKPVIYHANIYLKETILRYDVLTNNDIMVAFPESAYIFTGVIIWTNEIIACEVGNVALCLKFFMSLIVHYSRH